jgi:hypothetical protein
MQEEKRKDDGLFDKKNELLHCNTTKRRGRREAEGVSSGATLNL